MIATLVPLLFLTQLVVADWRCFYNPSTVIQGGIPDNKGRVPSVTVDNCFNWSNGCVPCKDVNAILRSFPQSTPCGFQRSYNDGCSMPDFNLGWGSMKAFWYEACAQHDFCYSDQRDKLANAGNPLSKEQCDDILSNNMAALCQGLDRHNYLICSGAEGLGHAILNIASQAQDAFDYDRQHCGARSEPWNGHN
ncbi:hypothetical protein HDU99_001959 [Rhizoclosmatium hyalinum]|nr:hypothetical protein HDU99_001959 [Rhizoclosmatium hyalinum]